MPTIVLKPAPGWKYWVLTRGKDLVLDLPKGTVVHSVLGKRTEPT
jgi:hypothetical protein